MAPHLNLVESDFEHLEKRVLPRFPFCYLTFKSSHMANHAFEVKDISQTGMQLALRAGEHGVKENEKINGTIHWQGRELTIAADVKWTTDKRLGVEFSHQPSHRTNVDTFLSIENFASSLKPIHEVDYGVELPTKLKYWFRSDGPVEVFVWRHSDGELSRFQFIIMENFIEWGDGKGLSTGRVISKRDIETPLINEDEFVFKMDPNIDDGKVNMAHGLMESYLEKSTSVDLIKFILLKLKR